MEKILIPAGRDPHKVFEQAIRMANKLDALQPDLTAVTGRVPGSRDMFFANSLADFVFDYFMPGGGLPLTSVLDKDGDLVFHTPAFDLTARWATAIHGAKICPARLLPAYDRALAIGDTLARSKGLDAMDSGSYVAHGELVVTLATSRFVGTTNRMPVGDATLRGMAEGLATGAAMIDPDAVFTANWNQYFADVNGYTVAGFLGKIRSDLKRLQKITYRLAGGKPESPKGLKC